MLSTPTLCDRIPDEGRWLRRCREHARRGDELRADAGVPTSAEVAVKETPLLLWRSPRPVLPRHHGHGKIGSLYATKKRRSGAYVLRHQVAVGVGRPSGRLVGGS